MIQDKQPPRNIIIIDDDKAIWQAYKSVLNYQSTPANTSGKRMTELLNKDKASTNQTTTNFNLTFASQGKDGYSMIQEAVASNQPFAVAFIDIRMPPGWDGMETAARIREIDPNIEFVIVTAYTDRSREEIVKTVGSPEKLLFLRKPFDPEELYQIALSLSEKWLITKQEKKAQKENRRLEEQYIQTQKMEAIGTLAGGIAHDLNNLLTPILGYTEISRFGLDPESDLAKNLAIIETSATKAANLIRQILTFSRKEVISPEIFDVNDLIKGFIKMLRRMIREDITLEIDLPEQLWHVSMDKGQLEQIVMNLVVNARDAVGKDGLIIISTANITIEHDTGITDTEGLTIGGNYVLLTVTDNGSGIDKETRKRVFEPFFTTKGLGEGTGLGLSTVYGIVKQHDGNIMIDSTPGKGTAFSIYLPRTSKEIEPLTSTTTLMQGGHETILLAEDDSSVRALACTLLESLGYKIICAENGREALSKYSAAEEQIDLLMTDVIMPGLGGCDLAAKLRDERPDLPVLFVSGYPQDMTDSTANSPHTGFIHKPFVLHALDDKIRQLLEEKT